MKKIGLFIFALTLGSFAMAQEKVKAETKVEITKEVKMVEENGEKTLTITTTENGVTTEEIFKGDAADKKMAEIQKEEAKNPAKREAARKEIIRKEKMAAESGTKNI